MALSFRMPVHRPPFVSAPNIWARKPTAPVPRQLVVFVPFVSKNTNGLLCAHVRMRTWPEVLWWCMCMAGDESSSGLWKAKDGTYVC